MLDPSLQLVFVADSSDTLGKPNFEYVKTLMKKLAEKYAGNRKILNIGIVLAGGNVSTVMVSES